MRSYFRAPWLRCAACGAREQLSLKLPRGRREEL